MRIQFCQFFAETYPQEIVNKPVYTAHRTSFYMSVLYLVITSNDFRACSTASNMAYEVQVYLSHQTTIKIALAAIRKRTVQLHIIKASVCSIASLINSHTSVQRPRHCMVDCLVDNMLLQIRPCSNQMPLPEDLQR